MKRSVLGPTVVLSGAAVCLHAAHAAAGVVYAWGDNVYGQVGDGTSTQRNAPVPVHGVGNIGLLTGVSSIAGGALHSLALLPDGTMRSWGYNAFGQLGDNTTSNRNIPIIVHGVGNVGTFSNVASMAGGYQTLAVLNDGTAWAWGYNGLGTLGDGTTTHRSTPVAVHGVGNTGTLGNVTFVAAGFAHSLARLNDGSAVGWGLNNVGEVGDGTTTNRLWPVTITGKANTVSLSGGDTHSVGATADGAAWGWGGNGGRLGDGTNTDRWIPTQVHGVGNVGFLSNVTQVAAGGLHSLALLSDGTVRAWGRNTDGELGNGTSTSTLVPVVVSGLTNIVDIEASIFSSYALAADGRLWVWGDNSKGQLGLGDTLDRNTPTEVFAPAGTTWLAIAAATDGQHMLALVSEVPAPGASALLVLAGLAVSRRRR